MKKRFVFLFLCLALLLSGCGISGDYREVEQLRLVRAVGVDTFPGGVRATVATESSGQEDQAVILSRPGASLEMAVDSLQQYASSQELSYHHTACFLLGEDAARQGVGEVMDYIERSAALPMGAGLFLVRGETAEALITGGGDEFSQSLTALERQIKRRGTGAVFSCIETARALSGQGAALVCAVSGEPAAGSVFGQENTALIEDGFGVLADGSLAGYLDTDEAIAACVLLGKGGMTRLALPLGSGTATLVLEDSGAAFSPVWDGSNLEGAEVSLKVKARLAELAPPSASMSREDLENLGENLSAELSRRVSAVLAKERELCADFLGLGAKLRKADRARFDAMAVSWPEVLRDMAFHVSVDALAEPSAQLAGSVTLDGNGRKNG